MSSDWYLDPVTGDLPDVFRPTEGVELILQRVTTRLRTFLGEVLEDKRAGLPFIRWASTKTPNLDEVVAFIRREVEGVPGVLRTEGVSAAIADSQVQVSMSVITPNDDALRVRIDLFGQGNGSSGGAVGLDGSDPVPENASPIVVITLLDSFIGI